MTGNFFRRRFLRSSEGRERKKSLSPISTGIVLGQVGMNDGLSDQHLLQPEGTFLAAARFPDRILTFDNGQQEELKL